MIIIDTNIWIDHLREADSMLTTILTENRQRVHPFVVGELALGSFRDRPSMIADLVDMPQAEVATHEEVMTLIAVNDLAGCGIGYVDTHLIASAKLVPGSVVWTRDKRLAAVCDRFEVSFHPSH